MIADFLIDLINAKILLNQQIKHIRPPNSYEKNSSISFVFYLVTYSPHLEYKNTHLTSVTNTTQ